MLGCHVVGERAVDITQLAAIAISAGLKINDFVRIPLSFPTYSGVLIRAALAAARELNLPIGLDEAS
jgi:pyruvate/2-oxoglutarate dehydrogenase complex dihydrolipoamide dehydrogenase (E3) component